MYLPALATNRPETVHAWCGPSLLVVDPRGRCGGEALTGFYFRQGRHLRELRLEIDGVEPFLCSLAEIGPTELEFAYIHPPVTRGGGGGSGSGMLGSTDGLFHRDLDLRLNYRVHPASFEAVLRITSRWQDDVRVDLSWVLSADYASVDEAMFGFRESSADVTAAARPCGVRFRYGHPRLALETEVTGEGADWVHRGDRLTASLALSRQRGRTLRLIVRAIDVADPIGGNGERERERRLAGWRARAARLYAPGETPLVEITNRAVTDLGSMALLEGAEDEWLTPGAGIPLYLSLWGRDALTTAWQAGIFDHGEMLADVVAMLGRRQGTVVDPARDEEPGRIINQAKTDPLTRVGATPFDRYYADFASPFMFVIGLGYLYTLTGDRETVRRHWESAKRVLDWAERYGDRDGDGYLEYLTASPRGPTHQGWKDSENAVVDHEGRPVDPPIAPCEIQGYYYASLLFMSALAGALGERARAVDYWRRAGDLKERFDRDFWLPDEGYVAFGLDAEKRPIRALTSNAGHCIPTGIVRRDRIEPLVRRLFAPDLFSGWGLRTLSTLNPAYNPLDYHLGSVWPVENATIVFGLRRYGLNARAEQLTRALYDLARLWPGGRAPECIGGYDRREYGHPGTYPRSNRPQTWNQSVLPLLVQSTLGLVPIAPLGTLLVDPVLPEWLPELTVRQLRVGEGAVSLRFRREETGASRVEVLDREGRLRVVRQPWLESISASPLDRLGGLAATAAALLHR